VSSQQTRRLASSAFYGGLAAVVVSGALDGAFRSFGDRVCDRFLSGGQTDLYRSCGQAVRAEIGESSAFLLVVFWIVATVLVLRFRD